MPRPRRVRVPRLAAVFGFLGFRFAKRFAIAIKLTALRSESPKRGLHIRSPGRAALERSEPEIGVSAALPHDAQEAERFTDCSLF